METYVLVHGSWHGAWCWEKVKSGLQAQGHSVITLDLPGHGQDRTPPAEITLQHYVDRVIECLDAETAPVILVGHSMAGVVVTQSAELRPDKIKTLVYLCAFLPQNGEFLLQLAQADAESLILPNLTINEAEGWIALPAAAQQEIFYYDCADEDAAWAVAHLTPHEPLAPLATPVQTSMANFGRVPRVYIECLADRAMGPATQKRMYGATPCHAVFSLNGGHSPFLAEPEALAGHLLAAATVGQAVVLEPVGL
jgi:pimeloyl-ACP methyl ester carboxylesterase